MSDALLNKKCVPCEGGVAPLSRNEAEKLLLEVPGWQLAQKDQHDQVEREMKFKDFKAALAFVNQVGALAENEGHHPNIYLHGWNKVKIEIYTHAINGLHENDFILAAKMNQLIKPVVVEQLVKSDRV